MEYWVSVKEKLPSKYDKYTVIINNEVDIINMESTAIFNGSEFIDIMGYPPVTHWKEIIEDDSNYPLIPLEGAICTFYCCQDTSIKDKESCNQYECPYHEVTELHLEF